MKNTALNHVPGRETRRQACFRLFRGSDPWESPTVGLTAPVRSARGSRPVAPHSLGLRSLWLPLTFTPWAQFLFLLRLPAPGLLRRRFLSLRSHRSKEWDRE